jgi:WD40 repeat protein
MQKTFLVLIIAFLTAGCPAVTSKIVRQKTIDDFSAGKTFNTVINSRGNITLASATEMLARDFNDTWLINSIVKNRAGAIYIGTSPNGKIFEYKDGKTTLIYPVEEKPKKSAEPNDKKTTPAKHSENLHIFRLAFDSQGKLLAGVSGDKCSLIRFDGKKIETVFEPNNTKYIFAIELDKDGNIFLGTGAGGNVWRLDKKAGNPEIVYSCKDKNVLCLAFGNDGSLYAGTDTRGLIYKIDTAKKTASILYDSNEDEITDLLFDSAGNLYAAATSYQSVRAQFRGSPEIKPFASGMPEEQKEPKDSEESQEAEESKTTADDDASLKIANTGADAPPAEPVEAPLGLERGRKSSESHIYKIDSKGFVTSVFAKSAVFFALHLQNDKLLAGTGNKAELFSINPKTETNTLIYEDKDASQITDIIGDGKNVYFSTANPAKLVMLKPEFSAEGSFESPLIDAGQPAKWGKLQLDADIPNKTKILLSARSGNVEDVNDATYSPWTGPIEINSPVDLDIPIGRFCQYKLILCGISDSAPVVREAAAAFAIPNLAPKITEILIGKADPKATPAVFKIDFKPEDDNEDQLVFRIDFRKVGRTGWIMLKDELDKPTYEFDSRTLEDGIYEIKVTTSDEPSNNQNAALTGSRISDHIIIDNSAPAIEEHKLEVSGKKAALQLKVKDLYSVIEGLSYTIDSNEKWVSVLPVDGIFDTKNEDFTIAADDLKTGPHVLTVKISDAENNTMYKTFDIEIK